MIDGQFQGLYRCCEMVWSEVSTDCRFFKKLYECLNPGGRFMVAHSESKEMINSRYSGDQVKKVSDLLETAEKEALYFKEYFEIDTLVDTKNIYLISGTRK